MFMLFFLFFLFKTSANHNETSDSQFSSSFSLQYLKNTNLKSFSIPASSIGLMKIHFKTQGSIGCHFGKQIHVLLYLAALLLAQSYAPEPNPGPRTPKYPCMECNKAVRGGQHAVCCDSCDRWVHTECMGMGSEIYNVLCNTDASWICCSCGLPNFCSSFFDTTILSNLTSNSFGCLSSLSNPDDPVPIATSSPIRPTKSKPPPRTSARPTQVPLARPLRILNVNCQSLNNKVEQFHAMCEYLQPDVIIGTESWLTPGHTNAEIFPPGYTTLRKDRPSHAGGVFLASKNDLIVTELHELDEDIEIIWGKIQVKGARQTIIGSFYCPPSATIDSLEKLDLTLSKLHSNHSNANIILGGDFNLPGIDWINNCVKLGSSKTNMSQYMLNLAADHSLTQMVSDPTHDKNILDLMLVSNPTKVTKTSTVPGLCKHDAILMITDIRPTLIKQPKRKVYLYNKADTAKLSEAILNINIPDDSTSDHAWQIFRTKIQEAMDQFIPTKLLRSKASLPWFNRSLTRQINKKHRWHQLAKSTKSQKVWNKYRHIQKCVRNNIRLARDSYLADILTPSMEDNPKLFWKYIKSCRNDTQGIPVLRQAGALITSAKEKALALNEYFQSVFTVENDQIPQLPQTNHPTIPDLHISANGIQKLLSNLNASKASGPDSIPARILKQFSIEITPLLTKIFTKSLTESQLPSDWLKANISPVFKKGDRSDTSNYRPISLTCISCKIFEHILHSHIMKHLDDQNILNNLQHGFRARRSCETQLTLTLHDLTHAIDKRKQIDMVILDFSKAFDTVAHNKLLLKLDHYGIRGDILKWIRCFLTQRKQCVTLEGASSTEVPVTSGVPQGTVLGPLLFLLYINDISANISSNIRLFADDCLLYRIINDPSDTLALQNDLNILESWQNEWQMRFNAKKCHVMRISRKRSNLVHDYSLCGTNLSEVKSYPYLGIHISNDLRWNVQSAHATSKANRALGVVRRNLKKCSKPLKNQAYISIVRPHLEYCSSAWDPYTKRNSDQLERVQRSALRFVCNNYSREPGTVTSLYNDTGWDLLSPRRESARLSLMFKIKNGLVDINESTYLQRSTTRTRKKNDYTFQTFQTNTDPFKYSFFPRTVGSWNELPNTVISAPSAQAFKEALYRHIH